MHLMKLFFFFFLVQVSKTDPSPKREVPTMILFNVVFALRVCKDIINNCIYILLLLLLL